MAGDLLVCVSLFTLTSGNVTQSAGTGTWTYVTANGDANSYAEPFTSWGAYRQYPTGDTSPTFAWSGTTTAYAYFMFALTSSVAGGSVVFDARHPGDRHERGDHSHAGHGQRGHRRRRLPHSQRGPVRHQRQPAIAMTTPSSSYTVIGALRGYAGPAPTTPTTSART